MQKRIKALQLTRGRLAGKLVSLTMFSFMFYLTACHEEDFPLDPDWLRPDIVVKPGGSIQAAVDAADPGDVILIKPGTYREAILVDKPNITLKGSGQVTIENPGGEEDGIRVLDNGDGFELHRVTLRGFGENGVFMLRADNYVLSHVTTIDCGEYGLFPIASNGGALSTAWRAAIPTAASTSGSARTR